MYRALTVCFLALLLALCACTKEAKDNPSVTPESTVRAYADAMNKGDLETALDCYADSALTDVGVGVVGLSENEIRNLFLKSLANSQAPYAQNKLANVTSKYLTAEVTYDLGGVKHTHTLVNQDGEWKLATDLTR